jgi:hypothetical protein
LHGAGEEEEREEEFHRVMIFLFIGFALSNLILGRV